MSRTELLNTGMNLILFVCVFRLCVQMLNTVTVTPLSCWNNANPALHYPFLWGIGNTPDQLGRSRYEISSLKNINHTVPNKTICRRY